MIDISGAYFPSLFIAIVIAVALTLAISIVFNYMNWSKYIWHPALFYVLLIIIFTIALLLTGIVPR